MNYSQQYLQKKRQAKYSHIIDEIKIYTEESLKLVGLVVGVGLIVLVIIGLS